VREYTPFGGNGVTGTIQIGTKIGAKRGVLFGDIGADVSHGTVNAIPETTPGGDVGCCGD
jgi:hypothetical protein